MYMGGGLQERIRYMYTCTLNIVFNLLGVEFSQDGEHDHTEGDGCDLVATADERREEHRVGRGSEHVTVHLLPPVLVTKIALLSRQQKKTSVQQCSVATRVNMYCILATSSDGSA